MKRAGAHPPAAANPGGRRTRIGKNNNGNRNGGGGALRTYITKARRTRSEIRKEIYIYILELRIRKEKKLKKQECTAERRKEGRKEESMKGTGVDVRGESGRRKLPVRILCHLYSDGDKPEETESR